MRKGLRIAPLILLGIVLVGLALYCLWPHERTYQGRPLSQWLQEYSKVWTNNITPTDRIQQRKDEERFAALGPAVVPDLVKMLEKRSGLNFDGKLGNQLIQFSATRRIGNWLNLRPGVAEYRRFEAAYLLGVLGPQAEAAIPAMIRIYQHTGESIWLRKDILESLARINRRPDLIVPVLAESLSGPQLLVETAGRALGEFGTNSIPAIPALRQTLHHWDTWTALVAAQTIRNIDPNASLAAVDEVMPLLVKALQSGNSLHAWYAMPLLSQYGDRAKVAVPPLVKILEEDRGDLPERAAYTLKRIDPEAAAKAGVQ